MYICSILNYLCRLTGCLSSTSFYCLAQHTLTHGERANVRASTIFLFTLRFPRRLIFMSEEGDEKDKEKMLVLFLLIHRALTHQSNPILP